jgi:hypothetical protein
MSDVFDDLIERQASPADVARIAAIVKSDFRFTYFGTAAFAVRLLRLDQKLADGIPMNPRRAGEHAQHQGRIVAGILWPSHRARRRDGGVVRRWPGG